MRSPAIIFSLFAVSALSPSLVYGSPVPMVVSHAPISDHHRPSNAVAARGLGFLNEVFVRADAAADPDAPKKKTTVASIAGVNVPAYVPSSPGFLPRCCYRRSPASSASRACSLRAANTHTDPATARADGLLVSSVVGRGRAWKTGIAVIARIQGCSRGRHVRSRRCVLG